MRRRAYETCVLPILEYCNTIVCTSDIGINKRIESLQGTAAKWVLRVKYDRSNFNIIHHSDKVEKLGWQSLKKRQENKQIILAHIILYSETLLLDNVYSPSVSSIRTSYHRVEPPCGDSNELFTPFRMHLKSRADSFFVKSAVLHNQLSVEECALTVDQLKVALKAK